MMFGYGCGWWQPFGTTGMIINLVIGMLLLAGIVWFAIWAVRRVSVRSAYSGSFTGQTPREILQMRYARGEIAREQYQQMLTELNQ